MTPIFWITKACILLRKIAFTFNIHSLAIVNVFHSIILYISNQIFFGLIWTSHKLTHLFFLSKWSNYESSSWHLGESSHFVSKNITTKSKWIITKFYYLLLQITWFAIKSTYLKVKHTMKAQSDIKQINDGYTRD